MSDLVGGVGEEDIVNIKRDVAMFMNSAHVMCIVNFAGKCGHWDLHLLAFRHAVFGYL